MAKAKDQTNSPVSGASGWKKREEEIQVKKMTRYPPSLNGINKNLP